MGHDISQDTAAQNIRDNSTSQGNAPPATSNSPYIGSSPGDYYARKSKERGQNVDVTNISGNPIQREQQLQVQQEAANKAEAQRKADEAAKLMTTKQGIIASSIIANQRSNESSQSTGVGLFTGDNVYNSGRSLAEIKALQNLNKPLPINVSEDIAAGVRNNQSSVGTQTVVKYAESPSVDLPLPRSTIGEARPFYGKQINYPVDQQGIIANIKANDLYGVYEGATEFLGTGYRAGSAIRKAQDTSSTTKEFFTKAIANPDVQSTALILGTAGLGSATQGARALGAFFYATGAEQFGGKFLANPSVKTATEAALFFGLPKLEEKTNVNIKVPKVNYEKIFFSEPEVSINGKTIPRGLFGEPLQPEFILDLKYEPQYGAKPIKTESGKVVGMELGLKEGQQTFPEVFSQPGIKVRKNEFGIPIEVGRPATKVLPKEKQLGLSKDFGNLIEVGVTNDMVTRLSPIEYAKYLDARRKIVFQPVGYENKYQNNEGLNGFTIFGKKGGYPTEISVREDISKDKFNIVLAHELIHYNTKPIAKLLLPGYEKAGLAYRLSPGEVLAFGGQEYFAKKGFKTNLGKAVQFEYSNPFKAEKLPEIPKFETAANKEKKLTDFGFVEPIPKNVATSRAYRKLAEPIKFSAKQEDISLVTGADQSSILVQKKQVSRSSEGTALKNEFKPSKGFFDVEYVPITNVVSLQRSENVLDIGTVSPQKPMVSADIGSAIKPINILDTGSKLKPKPEQGPKVNQITNPIQVPVIKTNQEPVQIQQQLLKIDTKQDQIQKPKPDQKFKQKETPEEIIKPEYDSNKQKKPFKNRILIKPRKKGYEVFTRVKGKWVKLSGSVSRGAALDIGARFVKSGLSSTFKLLDSSQPANEVQTGGEFARFSSTLRNYEVRKGQKVSTPNQFIEKRASRLLTGQERSAIKSAKSNSMFGKSKSQRWF